jgi:hypothetical protein
MDGNFSAEHMKCRTSEKDVPLSEGMAFMAKPEPYKAHLDNASEKPQVYMLF